MRRRCLFFTVMSTTVWLAASAGWPVRGDDPPASEAGDDGASPAHAKHPLGFAPRGRERQLEAETKALAVPTPENARKWLRTLTAEPHVAGTPADYKTAVFVRDKLREWGFKADLQEYKVLLNYPAKNGQALEITRPVAKVIALDEHPVASDRDSANSAAFGAFHGYGVSGVANGQLVYANYGRPDDYAALEKMGIDVEGKIVLVRYGEIFRGLKVRNAQKRGAEGILIFSDPGDDGFAKGDVYPGGPYRPGSAIQRGSVQFLSLGPGDPSTPFGPSTSDAKRLPIDDHNGFPGAYGGVRTTQLEEWEKQTGLKREDYFATIPSLPLSYDAAHEILKLLAGPNVPSGWQGGLPLAYHIGPGPAEAAMSVLMNYQLRTIWNVIATLPGSIEPERWIMIGNHRDAWVYGAVDPGSGTAATLEMCRALGTAYKNGWKPRRTILYASWDAEEYGLVGSTEWAEEHAKAIGEKAVLMLNVDSAVSGHELGMSGVPSLRDLALDAAAAITDPHTGKSLRSIWIEERRKAWAESAPLVLSDPLWDSAGSESSGTREEKKKPARFAPQMGWLGSGSDFTAYVDHLGVPAVDIGFRGSYGVYHSMYDDFNWMEKFGDPEFITHATAARLYTLLVMRAAAADVVPLKFVPYGLALREHVDQLRLIHAKKQRKAGTAEAELDRLPGLVAAVKTLLARAEALDRVTALVASRDDVGGRELAAINDALMAVERAFLIEKGLPGRTWFKHAIYAPGLTTGYACWPLPAIRQDIEEPNKAKLAADVELTTECIKKATAALERAIDCGAAELKTHD